MEFIARIPGVTFTGGAKVDFDNWHNKAPAERFYYRYAYTHTVLAIAVAICALMGVWLAPDLSTYHGPHDPGEIDEEDYLLRYIVRVSICSKFDDPPMSYFMSFITLWLFYNIVQAHDDYRTIQERPDYQRRIFCCGERCSLRFRETLTFLWMCGWYLLLVLCFMTRPSDSGGKDNYYHWIVVQLHLVGYGLWSILKAPFDLLVCYEIIIAAPGGQKIWATFICAMVVASYGVAGLAMMRILTWETEDWSDHEERYADSDRAKFLTRAFEYTAIFIVPIVLWMFAWWYKDWLREVYNDAMGKSTNTSPETENPTAKDGVEIVSIDTRSPGTSPDNAASAQGVSVDLGGTGTTSSLPLIGTDEPDQK